MKPTFFPTPSDFRSWLEKHHETEKELWVGFYKKGSGKPSITWPESVDIVLCFGWIDGIRKTIDEESYVIRFTPRKPDSKWSAVNIKKVKELQKFGLMRPAGLKRFNERKQEAGYSYEKMESIRLDKKLEDKFRANKKAWLFFQQQAPYHRKVCLYWVMSAKQEETRDRRLAKLIESCEKEKRL